MADRETTQRHTIERLAVNVARWQRIAVQLAVAGDGSYRLLSTPDRDMLEAALSEYRQAAQRGAARVAELGRDAAGGEPARGDPP